MLTTLRHIARHPLNRGAELGALSRYLRWQIGSRLLPGPVVVDYVGCKLIAKRGGGGSGPVYNGLHYFNDMGFMLHALRPGDVFVDVGANIGTYSLPAAGRGAKVVAFEPGEAFDELSANVRLNGSAIEARREAVGAEKGTLALTLGLDCVNRAAVAGENAQTVPMVRLDDVVPGALLVKIDVEGYEKAVLDGGERVISKAQAVIMEINGQTGRYGYSEQELLDRMAGWGFERVSYGPLSRQLGEPNMDENAIFIRDRKLVTARLTSAEPFTVRGRSV